MQRAILDEESCLPEKPDADTRKKYKRMREVILDEQYWTKTLELQALLKPFLQVTLALESNRPKLSRLYVYYTHLLTKSATSTSPLLPRSKAIELIGKWWNKIYHPLLTIAYLADPTAQRDRPVKVTEKQMEGIAIWLVQHYNGDKTKAVKVYADLFHLRARAGSFSNELNWNAAYNIDSIL